MKKGEIWSVEIPAVDGHEQTGTRPAIILAQATNIAIIIPLTSNVQALRFPYTVDISPSKKNGLDTTSIALVFQIRAIDRKRIKRKIGVLEEGALKDINVILKRMLDLD
ncbi:MAG TPA: type II toxin-antitoxin system PemK/MazF family toxin [Candidatus Nanoarchaeia archaeon]|nr:type II toxin-antitoxin system PemK/MazF family toxin [Candidatus Nanoarchaeia archaeon]